MGPFPGAEDKLAARGAFAGAALFVALIVAFSTSRSSLPTANMLLVIGMIGAVSHLVLLPVVPALSTAAWVRACGYGWLLFDVVLNVASVNGADRTLVAALRLGGHIPAGLWMAVAAYETGGAVRALGVPLGTVLVLYSFVAPRVPEWVLFIPFALIPVWLTMVGWELQRGARAQAIGNVA